MSTLPATITPAMARRIEIWPTARLVPYARNARTHSPEQVAQIAASIVEFGFINPILVDSDATGSLPATVASWRPASWASRRFRWWCWTTSARPNGGRTSSRTTGWRMNAGWDEKVLAARTRANWSTRAWTSRWWASRDAELEALLAGSTKRRRRMCEEDVPEPPAQPVTRPGDVWLIGRHRLICGDCRDRNVVASIYSAGARANVVHHVAAVRHAARVRLHRAGSSRSRRRSTSTGIGMWPRTSRRSSRTMAPTS